MMRDDYIMHITLYNYAKRAAILFNIYFIIAIRNSVHPLHEVSSACKFMFTYIEM